MAKVDGVDLSHWQSGALNFNAARAAGVKFVYHKATEGLTFTDGRYTMRRKQVGAANLLFGAYHFAKPGVSNGTVQAKAFLDFAKVVKTDARPMLDLEDQGGLGQADLTKWVLDFNAEVKRQTGDDVVLYTNFNLGPAVKFLPLWVARYNDAMAPPNIPTPWSKYTIWQFSNGSFGKPDQVAGIGHCDLNTFGAGVTLTDLTIGGSVSKAQLDKVRERVQVAKKNQAKVQKRADRAKARLHKINARLRKLLKKLGG